MTDLLDQAKNLVVFDGDLTIHAFSTLVFGLGKYWVQELSTSLSDNDFGTNGFNESHTSVMEVNGLPTVLSKFFSDIHRQNIFQRLQVP